MTRTRTSPTLDGTRTAVLAGAGTPFGTRGGASFGSTRQSLASRGSIIETGTGSIAVAATCVRRRPPRTRRTGRAAGTIRVDSRASLARRTGTDRIPGTRGSWSTDGRSALAITPRPRRRRAPTTRLPRSSMASSRGSIFRRWHMDRAGRSKGWWKAGAARAAKVENNPQALAAKLELRENVLAEVG